MERIEMSWYKTLNRIYKISFWVIVVVLIIMLLVNMYYTTVMTIFIPISTATSLASSEATPNPDGTMTISYNFSHLAYPGLNNYTIKIGVYNSSNDVELYSGLTSVDYIPMGVETEITIILSNKTSPIGNWSTYMKVDIYYSIMLLYQVSYSIKVEVT